MHDATDKYRGGKREGEVGRAACIWNVCAKDRLCAGDRTERVGKSLFRGRGTLIPFLVPAAPHPLFFPDLWFSTGTASGSPMQILRIRDNIGERWGKIVSRENCRDIRTRVGIAIEGPGTAAISRERGRVLCDQGSTEKPVSLAEGPLARALSPFLCPSLSASCSAKRTEYESHAGRFNRRSPVDAACARVNWLSPIVCNRHADDTRPRRLRIDKRVHADARAACQPSLPLPSFFFSFFSFHAGLRKWGGRSEARS